MHAHRTHWPKSRKVLFSPDGNTLATASSDGTVKLWRAATDPEALRRKRRFGAGQRDIVRPAPCLRRSAHRR